MKDEIKEILDFKEDADYKRVSVDEILILKDYITNLQEENKMYAQLKEEYEDIIDKAIEYINWNYNHYRLSKVFYDKVKNILTGGDEE